MADAKIRFSVEGGQEVENYVERLSNSTRSFVDLASESSRSNRETLNDLESQAAVLERIGQISESNNRVSAQPTGDAGGMRASAESLAREMISSSMAASTSGRDVLQDVNAQISAIERKNKIEEQIGLRDVSTELSAGRITEPEARTRVASIRQESAEDKLQTQLLRDLITTIKDTSKREIVEDRGNVEAQITSDRNRDRLGEDETEDEFDRLKLAIQREELADDREDDIEEISGGPSAGGVQQGVNVAANVASRNQYFAAAALAGMIPIIGNALSGLMTQAFSQAQGYQVAMGRNVAISGGTQEDLQRFGIEGERMGYTMQESLDLRAQASRARGRGANEMTVSDLQTMQRGLGLDQNLLLGMERLQRGETGDSSTKGNVQTMISALRSTGAIQGGDTSLLPEYLQELTELGNQQLITLGRVDTGVNIKTIAALSSLDESFQNPEVLKGVLASIRGGLQQAPTEQGEALQFAALSRVRPQASLWDLEKVREAPLAEGNIDYLKSYLGDIEKSSGGDQEQFYRNVYSLGLAPSRAMSEKLVQGFQAGNLDTITENFKKGGSVDLKGRAEEATSELVRATAVLNNQFAEKGDLLVKAMDGVMETFTSWMKEQQKTTDAYAEVASGHNKLADELEKSAEKSEGLTKATKTLTANILRLPLNQL